MKLFTGAQQRTVEQRIVVLVLRVVKEMVKVDHIIPGAYGVDVSVVTQSQVPTIKTDQKTVKVLLQLQLESFEIEEKKVESGIHENRD